MTTPKKNSGQGCPQRARLEAAEAAVLSFTEPYQKWPLYDAKVALRTAREDYEAAVIAKYQARPAPPPDYPTATYWEEVVLPAKAKLARVRQAKGPWADEIDALYASAAAEVAYDALCGQPFTRPRSRAISNGVVRTGKTAIVDGVRVPRVIVGKSRP